MNLKHVWAGIFCILLIVLLAGDTFSQEQRKQNQQRKRRWRWKGPEIGSVIQDFELPTLDGKKFKLSDNKGKIIIIELGACT